MTVAELRALLRDFPDHYNVFVPGKNGSIAEPSIRAGIANTAKPGEPARFVMLERKDRT
jgi:hypothetical protein